jgi:hypothetical protein
MFEVHIKGFKTLEAAQQFASWFDNQGEQDITYWWEPRLDEGMPVGKAPRTKGPADTTGNVVTMTVSN